jgi:hypothetical protein
MLNPPMMKIPTSLKVLLPNQTNANETINTAKPMMVVFGLRNKRSIIVFRFCVVRAGIEYRGTLCK